MKMRSLILLVLLGGCLVRNPDTCDDTHPCVNAMHECVAKKCVPRTALDMSVPDLSEPGDDGGSDGGGVDAAVDLMPQCTTHMGCVAATPLCEPVGSCRACATMNDDTLCTAREPAKPRCQLAGANAGQCVECRAAMQASDCPTVKPVCEGGACRACASAADCAATGICKSNGACAMESEVAFVDNDGLTVTACKIARAHDGSSQFPFCDIQEGIPGTKPYIRVTGRATAYDFVEIAASRNVTIIAPSPSPTPPMIASSDVGKPNVGISLASGSATVVLDGVQIGGATVNAQDGLSCSASGSGAVNLTIRRSTIRNAFKTGLHVNGCNLVADQNLLTRNNGNGAASGTINLEGTTTYVLANNFIYKNTSDTNPAIQIGNNATGTFQLNTIADNSKIGGGVAGINCGSGSFKIIEGSIFWGNTTVEAAGNCSFSFVDIDDNTIGAQATNLNMDPGFMNTTTDDYRITANACVDKVNMTVDGGASMRSDHDFFGTRRPLGAAHDIGAHESK